MPTSKKKQQGKGSPDGPGKNKSLVTAIGDACNGTDEVVIGGKGKADNTIKTATMAEAAKLITSVRYLVRGWIPYGMVTGLIAEPGVGKSAFALWLARTIVTGKNWFTGLKGPEAGYVLWCATENDLAITKLRMEQWKIPPERLILPLENPLDPIDLLEPKHLERIKALVYRFKTKAIFVDSLRGSYSGDENDSRSGEVLRNLAAIAEETNVAVLVVHHTKKLADGEEISANSSRGSNAIIALFRSQLGFDRPDKDNPAVRVRMLKENLGLAPQPIGFTISDTGLSFVDAPTKPQSGELADAKEWLLATLASGPMDATELWEKAKSDGLCEKTVKSAKKQLGIKSAKGKGKGAGWQWLPPARKLAPPLPAYPVA